MRSGNKRQTVVVVESFRDILAEGIACTTGRDSPSATVIGIRPQQVAHGALVGNLLDSVERSDVVERVDARGKTAVQAEDLVVNQGGERKIVEKIGKVLPDVGITILAQALVVEAVYLCDLARLVVAAQNGDAVGVSDLEGDEQSNSLN